MGIWVCAFFFVALLVKGWQPLACTPAVAPLLHACCRQCPGVCARSLTHALLCVPDRDHGATSSPPFPLCATFSHEPTVVWREAVRQKRVEETRCHVEDASHGYCVGVFVA